MGGRRGERTEGERGMVVGEQWERKREGRRREREDVL